MKKTIKLARTRLDHKGKVIRDRAQAVLGEEVIDEEVRDFWSDKHPKSTRWYVIRTVIVEGGYTIGIGRLTCWQPKEQDCYWVHENIKTREGVIALLRECKPPIAEELIERIDRALEAKSKGVAA